MRKKQRERERGTRRDERRWGDPDWERELDGGNGGKWNFERDGRAEIHETIFFKAKKKKNIHKKLI